MSREFEKRLTEWALWFHENKDRIADPHKRWGFTLKALDGCLELLACAAQDIQHLEGRPKDYLLMRQEHERDERRGPRILVPVGVKITGDLHKVG